MVVREYELTLPPDGRVVVFRELGTEEFEILVRAEQGKPGSEWEIPSAGLRRSLVSIDGVAVKYQDLIGNRLGERFRTAELMILRQAWTSVHLPDAAAAAAAVGGMKVTAG